MDTALVRYKAAQGSIPLRSKCLFFFLGGGGGVINTLFHLGIIFD